MRLFFVVLLSLMVAPSVRPACAQQSDLRAPVRVALVIGNANYQDADAPLKGTGQRCASARR